MLTNKREINKRFLWGKKHYLDENRKKLIRDFGVPVSNECKYFLLYLFWYVNNLLFIYIDTCKKEAMPVYWQAVRRCEFRQAYVFVVQRRHGL